MTQETTPAPVAILVGRSRANLWGISGEERLRRLMRRAGLTDDRILEQTTSELPALPAASRIVLLRADHAFEEPVVKSLVATDDTALLPTDGGTAPAAITVSAEHAAEALRVLLAGEELSGSLAATVTPRTPTELAGEYNTQLRKRAEFYVLSVTPQTRAAVERRMFAGSYKGVTDIVTLVLFPWPSRMLTGLAARIGLAPNHVTTIGLICTIATFYFWWIGEFGWGFLTGWAMMLLDTVDGKLARVTLTSSRFGDIYDHAIDLVHPPFWYWAYMVGLGHEFPWLAESMAVLVFCYVMQRLQEGFFITRFGLEMHIWRRFDSRFRSITARRDVNVAILTIFWAVGFEALGMVAVVAWTVLSLGVHTVQILQARGATHPLTSWLAEGEAGVTPAATKSTLLRH